ncbi:MAG: hypothetical protein Q7S02_05950 [bacterium]|nr:hypothetical protein [bacterium]
MNDGSLILCDVDETLIDTHYEFTVPHDDLTAAIRHAEARGVIVGLNSDSGLATLERYAMRAGISGPIIAERGALVQSERDTEPEVLVRDATQFLELRSRFLDTLMDGQRRGQYVVILGDVNELSKPLALPSIPPRVLPSSTAVLVNGIRTCSLAFYVRKRVHYEWVTDAGTFNEVVAILEEVGPRCVPLWSELDELDRNSAYGICIVHHKDTQKPRAVDWILQQAGERKVYMIGNSTADDLKDPRVIQCAVGNARPEYKARCTDSGGFIAAQPLTAGVIELLERITQK